MTTTINGEPRELTEGTTLEKLLRELEVGSDGIAVAVNEQVIPRARFAQHTVGEGDAIEIIRAVAGG